VLYPYVTRPDILVVMSQEAYVRFAPELEVGGILIVEQDMVRVSDLNKDVHVFSIPATRIAEELGKRMVLNSVMMGFFTAVTRLLDAEAVRKAVADSVPKSFLDLNLKAFRERIGIRRNRSHRPRELRRLQPATGVCPGVGMSPAVKNHHR